MNNRIADWFILGALGFSFLGFLYIIVMNWPILVIIATVITIILFTGYILEQILRRPNADE